MKKRKLIISIVFCFFFLVSCGITEELEQAKNSVTDLKELLDEQETQLESFNTLVEGIVPAFTADIETEPETGLFVDEEGELFKNFSERQELAAKIDAQRKAIKASQKEIKRIVSKKAVDVDNKKLTLISKSLDIIANNLESFGLYSTTGIEQESELYENLPVDNLDQQHNLISRTYGSLSLVSEEATANIEYSISLINQFIKEANKQTPK